MWETLWPWLQAHEYIAIWLEGIALILILGLDWMEWRNQRRERREQHEETAAQLKVAQSQAEATKKSADAAIEAALAAKRSAEIAAALHRPFMGLDHVKLSPDPNSQNRAVWSIEWSIKNFGTLPASQVEAGAQVRLDENILLADTGATGAEVFPQSDPLAKVTNYAWDVEGRGPDRGAVMSGVKPFVVRVGITYASPDGHQYKHTADAKFNSGYATFTIIKSKTETIQ